MSKAKDIESLIVMLYAAHQKKPTSDELLAYLHGVGDLSIESITSAVKKSIRADEFLPSPGKLRGMCGVIKDADRALIAWDAVLRALPLGAYKTVAFDDRFTNATIRNLGGWPQFVSRFSGAEEEKWARKEFIDTYGSMLRSNVNGDVCRPLPGISQGEVVIDENGNRVVGKPVPRIVSVGLPDASNPLLIAKSEPPKSISQSVGLTLKGVNHEG